jgi:Mrp family chromosome partitioning ATPase/uncharacterized protein involved in exopolysaccharide biosynthesis
MNEHTILLPNNPQGNGHDASYKLTVLVPKRRYFSYLRERWWVVLVCLVLSLSAVIAYETLRDDTFNSYARLYVTTGGHLGGSIFNEINFDFATQIELLKSARLRGAALQDLGPRGAQLKKAINVDVVRPMSTAILQLRATGSDPGLTQTFLQALITNYLAFKKETRVSTAEDLVSLLNDQLSVREKELTTEREKWVEYQRTNDLAVLEQEAKSAGSYLADLHLELAKLEMKEDLLKKGLTRLPDSLSGTNGARALQTTATNDFAGQSATNGPTFSVRDTDIKNTRVALAIAIGRRAELLSQFSQTHPAIRTVNSEIDRLTNTLAILERQSAEQQRLDLAEVQEQIAAIETALPAVNERVAAANDRLTESRRRKNDLDFQQTRYDSSISMRQNVDLSKSLAQERISVLEVPSIALPSERDLPLRIVLAAAGGIFVGLGLVFGWYLADDRFVSVNDVKDQFGEGVLGLVPEIKVPRAQPREALLQTGDRRTGYAESFRHLRSALLLSTLGGSRPHTLLVTGAGSIEGKSTVAVNLARVLALSGLRVALVDADTHTTGLGKMLVADGKPGVLDFLRGEAESAAVMHATDVPGLTLVPAGTHADQAEGALLRPQLGQLITEIKTNRDFVIIDAAPILRTDDTALLVPYADTVVVVVRPFFSRSRLVRRVLEMLYQRQAKQITFVLNRARKDDIAGYYAHNGLGKVSSNGNGTSVEA